MKKFLGVLLVLLGLPFLVSGATRANVGYLVVGALFVAAGVALFRSNPQKKEATTEEVISRHAANTKEAIAETVDKAKDMDLQSKTAAIGQLIRRILDDGVLDHAEEEELNAAIDKLGLTLDDIPMDEQRLLGKGVLIRDLLEGNVKPRVNALGLPFKLMKSEVLVWAFQPVHVSEIKTVKEWEAGHKGVSLRVAKGVYWHLGKTKGRRVEKTELKDLGSGIVAVTSKHVYMLTGSQDSLRIRHDKIVTIIPEEDGLILYREGARANPLYFETADAWFFANVVQNASNWDK